MSYIIGFALALLLFAVTYLGKHFTVSGAVVASIIVALFSIFNLWSLLLLLLFTYIMLMVSDNVTAKRRKPIADSVLDKSGARTAVQIFANGFAPLLSTVIFVTTENRVFLIIFAVGVGVTFADSIASDIGIFSRKAPRDICTWKQTAPGLSGGVSSLGVMLSIAASICFSIMAYVLMRLSLSEAMLIALFSFVGSILDSILGSRLQVKYRCEICNFFTEKKRHCDVSTRQVGGLRLIDNCTVNLISSLVTCSFSFLLLAIGG